MARRARRGVAPWMQGLGCGLVAALATPTAALAGGLLAPAIATIMLDRREGRALTRTVLLAGLAAAARPLATLWVGGHGMELALALLADPANLGLAWIAQGAGWLACEALPLAITASLNAQAAARAGRLRRVRAELQAEWDLPPPPETEDVSAEPPAGG